MNDTQQTAPKQQTQTQQQSPGYTINEHGYQYDDRYKGYDAKTDYTAKQQMAEKAGNNQAAAFYEAKKNQKVQSMYPNDPKYSTSNKYGQYLNQIRDPYLNYLNGTSKDAYTVDAKTASMLGNYDKTFQYSQAIKNAADSGNYKTAAVLEYLMNQKIKNENLPYLQQDNYSPYLNGITQSDVNIAKYGSDVTPTGNYYKVNPDGKAPKGLKSGDLVVTNNGTWMITTVNPDGSYSDAVPYDKSLNVNNYTGGYSTPSSVLQTIGLESPQGTYDPIRDVYMPGEITEADLNQGLQDQYDVERQQIRNQIDYATQTGVNELQRAYEDALPTYASQRGQADLQGEKAAKNSALYAEQRGDRGGIGQAQYNALQIAKANQINQINTAQNKLASDTARQIADLRSKGEFEMADKMLSLAQSYLSQMNENKKWIANYNISRSQLDMQSRGQENDYLQMMAGLTGRMPDGSLTADQAQRQVQNWQWLVDTVGSDPYGNTGITTLNKQKMDLDQSNYEREWQKSLIDSLIEGGGIPSAASLAAVGYTDPAEQTAMQWAGQINAILNRNNILSQLGVDLPYAQGYPSTAPGTSSSITTGGGVGTTSSSGSSGGGGSGGSKSGSKSGNGNGGSNPTPTSNDTGTAPKKSNTVDAVTAAAPSISKQSNDAINTINNLLLKT